MPPAIKPVRLSGHAREQARFRGATELEIVETVRSEKWGPAEGGRLECRRDFPFNSEWNGKRYATKRVRPVFADNPTEIVVVTVYVYFS